MLAQSLPWLPRGADLRAGLGNLPEDAVDAVEALRHLSRSYWGEGDLRFLGRRIRAQLERLTGLELEKLSTSGLLPLKILAMSASSLSHMSDALIATGLRYGFLLQLEVVEYEEQEPWLDQNADALIEQPPDFVLLATDSRMEPLSSTLGDPASADQVVDAAIARTRRIAERAAARTGAPVIVQTVAGDPAASQINMDLGLPGTARYLTSAFNNRLAQLARDEGRLLLDVEGLASLVGQQEWTAGRYWFAAKHPFSMAMIPLYADRVMRLAAAHMGRSKRVLVLDLDNTVWGGIVGDDGLEGLTIGSGSPLGEAHTAVQRMALACKERGVLLCVSSKNEESTALRVFREHPEMLLKEDDIVAFRVNWEDKAANILALSRTLDLGLESFVFLDDNPAERKRVREALPVVAVPEVPVDPTEWPAILQAAGYFEQVAFSTEDRQRGEFYRANAGRVAQMEKIGDHDDYLRSLQMSLQLSRFDLTGRKRITQLISKSNQFNLTTRRYSESEVANMEAEANVLAFQVRLSDVFGDNGMISVVIVRKHASWWEIDTWLMSCRVLGRRVEEAVLQHLVTCARLSAVAEIRGRYIPSAKNGMVKDLYSRLGFERVSPEGESESVWRLAVSDYTDKALPMLVKA